MTTIKPWYLSRTIWASAITILIAFAGLTGLPVDKLDHAALTDAILQTVAAISGIVAVFGRLFATTRLK